MEGEERWRFRDEETLINEGLSFPLDFGEPSSWYLWDRPAARHTPPHDFRPARFRSEGMQGIAGESCLSFGGGGTLDPGPVIPPFRSSVDVLLFAAGLCIKVRAIRRYRAAEGERRKDGVPSTNYGIKPLIDELRFRMPNTLFALQWFINPL
ncbi:hypothetical protein L249_3708 [Ophiocordyceps polyrhachis-furcata BCC 54312]|uniref:Uncharacterized protein n=1 Tax=Ophiocordyceps polyrhachis-furcata BCC 54312 TaxID=1330021 RepID=A0A367L4P1_9HYPO|nr:hypothetical protein L249_3708 [Ophiocordyceps polyrhachis-furcata BCC 54312]